MAWKVRQNIADCSQLLRHGGGEITWQYNEGGPHFLCLHLQKVVLERELDGRGNMRDVVWLAKTSDNRAKLRENNGIPAPLSFICFRPKRNILGHLTRDEKKQPSNQPITSSLSWMRCRWYKMWFSIGVPLSHVTRLRWPLIAMIS